MRIYTKTGDRGETSFYGGVRVSKDDLRIESLGSIDELNAVIGVTLCFVEDEKIRFLLHKIQDDLFTLGADVASTNLNADLPKIKSEHVADLEKAIDTIEAHLILQKSFILPGGTTASSFLHLSRTIARRAERILVKVSEQYSLNSLVLCYINRLSDLFFILARKANNEVDVKEQQPIYKYFAKENV